MKRWSLRRTAWAVPLIAAALASAAPRGEAAFEITLHPRAGVSPADSAATVRTLAARLAEALSYLNAYGGSFVFADEMDVVRATLDRVTDEAGPIPISYTFPDRRIRLAPEFAAPLDDSTAAAFFRGTVALGTPLEAILDACGPEERAQVPRIAREFIVSELVHECYHDWQNRTARFQTVDRARAALVTAVDAIGPDWRAWLAARGVDLRTHDRELTRAEIEACTVQRGFWIRLYGERPAHPLARAILSLMADAQSYYRARLRAL
jgi:hypothetical protein